jgi:hypothetical protein
VGETRIKEEDENVKSLSLSHISLLEAPLNFKTTARKQTSGFQTILS